MVTLLLGGLPQQATAGAATFVDRMLAWGFRVWDRLSAGDVLTWAAFVAVALFALLFVGLWTGSITIKRVR